MPRKEADRPKVVPDGCVNLGFLGQFVETPGDVVFTVEMSVRTAMEAVYQLTASTRSRWKCSRAATICATSSAVSSR